MNLVLPDNLANQAVMKNPPALAQFAPLTAAELSHAIAAGDATAFEEFYRRYAPRVYGLLMALTSANDDLARDLLQAVMLRAARKFKSAATDDALWAWLATIARNALIDHIRSDQRRRRREQSAVAFPSAPDPPGISEELTETLEQALAELDPNDQALIRDFYFNTQSQAAIAASNQTTVKALQSRLARIRRRLKEILTCKLDHEN
jgi:RNA polymerase sigma-70 factor, ECF subfamily